MIIGEREGQTIEEREKGGWNRERVAIDAANYLQLSHLYRSLVRVLGCRQTDWMLGTMLYFLLKRLWECAYRKLQPKNEMRLSSRFEGRFQWWQIVNYKLLETLFFFAFLSFFLLLILLLLFLLIQNMYNIFVIAIYNLS